jgi:hypothetical protein
MEEFGSRELVTIQLQSSGSLSKLRLIPYPIMESTSAMMIVAQTVVPIDLK